MNPQLAVEIDSLTHRYGERIALNALSAQVFSGELFGVLGPNGSGKTTLFRILSTLIPPTSGHARIFGEDVVVSRDLVRRSIGVVFQSPSLDKQLTAGENLRHHGRLYGMGGKALTTRIAEMLAAFGIADRVKDRVGSLSGGMRRRVELAKGLLTTPRLLLLDEPSTGLDPSARIDLWQLVERVRKDWQITVVFTTHLMDEADRCDRLAIMKGGEILACDAPGALKDRIGGDVISATGRDPQSLVRELRGRFGIEALDLDGRVQFERSRGHAFVPELIEALPAGSIESISVGRPTLEDVFVQLTGHEMRGVEGEPAGQGLHARHT